MATKRTRSARGKAKAKPVHKTGRPTKLTPQVEARILKVVVEGNYAETAAEAAGIDRATFLRWMQRGRDGLEPYAAFAAKVTRARAEAETKLVRVIRQSGGAQGAQWLLERTRRRFAARVNLKVEHELEEFLDVAERVLDRDSYVRLLTEFDAKNNDLDVIEPVDPGREAHAEH